MNHGFSTTRRRSLLAAPGLLASGCAWMRPVDMPPMTHEPGTGNLPRPIAPRGLALVLSGGSARGFAHIGVLKVLEEAGIRPDLVAGASAGAIVATLYASGKTAQEIEAISRIAEVELADDAGWVNLLLARTFGVRPSHALHAFIDRQIGSRLIEDMLVPLAIVATDFATGKEAAFTRGDAGRAVQASCAIPGAFEPVAVGGRLHADGGLACPMPVNVARRLGARRVIAVDVVYPPGDSPAPRSLLDAMLQTFLVQTWRLKEAEISAADLVIVPTIPRTDAQYGFKDREMLIAAGEAAARRALPALHALSGRHGSL